MGYPSPASEEEPSRELMSDWNLGGEGTSDLDPAADSLLSPGQSPVCPGPPAKAGPLPPRTPDLPRTDVFPGPTDKPSLRTRRLNFPADRGSSVLFHHFSLGASGPPGAGLDSLIRLPGPPTSSTGRAVPRDAGSEDLASERNEPKPPAVGDVLCGFRLVGELGRGAFARVFLAEQSELGGRRVALKVSKAEGEEPQLLARLQHSHIVPILSLHDDPVSGLRLMCMPYLGGANLAQVLEAWGRRGDPKGSRVSLVDALDRISQRRPAPEPLTRFDRRTGAGPLPVASSRLASGSLRWPSTLSRGSRFSLKEIWSRLSWPGFARPATETETDDRDYDQPSRRFLRHSDDVRAAVWVMARLAEGLEHAHSRGLLHRDLKPSNVLIAGDGTPMLLDFNLSAESRPESAEESERALLGGTLPYMSPEHLDAFHPDGETPPEEVDERSDVYSLGLILYEVVAGHPPFSEPPSGLPLMETLRILSDQRRRAPSLRSANPAVPWSLDAIVKRCLDPDPHRRYQRARDLAEDLNRFLGDLPNRFAAEPSLWERLAKWSRRNQRACSSTSIATLALVLILALGGLIGYLNRHQQELHARLSLRLFRTRLDSCRLLLNVASGPTNHLSQGIEEAAGLVESLALSRTGLPTRDSWIPRLNAEDEAEVRQGAAEVLQTMHLARIRLASSEAARKHELLAAVEGLTRAERLFPGHSASIYEERARCLAALGEAKRARADRELARRYPPATAREFLLLGSGRLMNGDLPGAEPLLLRARSLDPKSFWAWFVLGICRFDQGRYLEAAGDFSACVALEPGFAWASLNRGISLARAGRLSEARASYKQAVLINTRFAEAWFNLGLVELELDNLTEAQDAFSRALALGLDKAGTSYALAEVMARRGDREGAEALFEKLLASRKDDVNVLGVRGLTRLVVDPEAARRDFQTVLSVDPGNARARYGLARLVYRTRPGDALAELNTALESEPGFLDAVQLRALVLGRMGDPAAVEDVERLVQAPSRHRLYNAACALALLAGSAGQERQSPRAVALLERALEEGFPVAQAAADPDLQTLGTRADYQKLIRRFNAREG